MAKRYMARSKIGYSSPEVPQAYGWNPGGFGCSGGCEGCWSRALAKRFSKCEKCRNFEVHLHPERLCEPANTKTPGVVLVNFTCDTFDAKRSFGAAGRILGVAVDAPQHTYVWLTKNADGVRNMVSRGLVGNQYLGLTIRNQPDLDAKWGVFSGIPGNLFLSLEPLWGAINTGLVDQWELSAAKGELHEPRLAGVIVGHDNRRGAPGTDTLDHIRSIVAQCKAAGVNCYVKQLWVWRCPDCGQHHETNTECLCSRHHAPLKPRLLRASHPDEFALFPSDLRLRDLPWAIPGQKGQ